MRSQTCCGGRRRTGGGGCGDEGGLLAAACAQCLWPSRGSTIARHAQPPDLLSRDCDRAVGRRDVGEVEADVRLARAADREPPLALELGLERVRVLAQHACGEREGECKRQHKEGGAVRHGNEARTRSRGSGEDAGDSRSPALRGLAARRVPSSFRA